MAFLFTVGAAWTALVSLALDGLLARGGGPAAASAPPRAVPWRRRTRAWWLSLRSFPGWQYTARITLSLAAAELVALAWGAHHGAWIVLTVALVVHRRPSASFDRAVQRGAGTVLGVLVGSLFLVGRPPLWGLVAAFAVLAGARPVLRAGNYAAYSAAMTPLVVLLMDFGRARPPSVLVDRLLATLAGCVLALVLGYAVWLPLLQAERPDAPRRPDPAGR